MIYGLISRANPSFIYKCNGIIFKDNPKLTADLIIQATKDYLNDTPVRYVMNPHYFVTKGIGAQKTHTVLNWVNYPKEDGESKFEDEDMDDANKLFV